MSEVIDYNDVVERVKNGKLLKGMYGKVRIYNLDYLVKHIDREYSIIKRYSKTDSTYSDEWQKKVNEKLKSYNYNQKEMADIIGITEASISRKLNNERKWSVDDLIKISRAFKCNINELLGVDNE